MTTKNTILLFAAFLVILSMSETVVSQSPAALARTVSPAFFDSIIRNAGAGCSGKRFYTRNAFLTAANTFPTFLRTVTRREIAAMFAHFTHETGSFCFIEEINKATYCQSRTQFPCAPGKRYYGRGPMQLTWNYNYGPAGRALGVDILRFPERVAQDPVLAFRTALWYWMTRVRPVVGRGFGATIRAINGGECGGGNPRAVQARIGFYKTYCSRLGVSPGTNLSC